MDAVVKVYKIFNKQIFNNKLPNLGVTPSAIKQTIRFTPVKPFRLLQIGTPIIEVQTHLDFFDDLLHEMVHIHNFINGISDVSRNQYHRREFTEAALEAGLWVGKHKNHGWGLTASMGMIGGATLPSRNRLQIAGAKQPTKEAIKRRQTAYEKASEIIPTNFLAGLRKEVEKFVSRKQKKQYQYKHTCKCGKAIWTGRKPTGDNPVRAVCKDCGTDFKFVGSC